MFNRRRIKELECQVKSLESMFSTMRDRYWNLSRKHDRLIAHLGLTEQQIPQRTILTTKGGPEQSE
jgi:predicted nuclease with TOPRIM domain